VSETGEAYPYVSTRAPEPDSGSVASQLRSANGQCSGELVPMPGTSTMLSLNVSGRTELQLVRGSISLDCLLRGVGRIPQDLKVAGGRKARCRRHQSRRVQSRMSQGESEAMLNMWAVGG
jgi:hypothetical protein